MSTPLPPSKATFTPQELLRLTGGEWSGSMPERVFENVVSDSRQVTEGSIFVALTGERFDGHRLLLQRSMPARAPPLWPAMPRCPMGSKGHRFFAWRHLLRRSVLWGASIVVAGVGRSFQSPDLSAKPRPKS